MQINKEYRINKYIAFMPQLNLDHETLDNMGFFESPASTKYHGAYEGGLFDHSFMVAKELVNLTERLDLEWERPESPYIVGMFHDFCKVDNYKRDIETGKFIYNPDMILCGHGDKSVIMTMQYMNLTDEEIACIRWHMGAFETDPKMWDYYSKAIESYPNVLFTHTADMIASKIIGV